jgi:poly(3-hydroxybutyrate) depolymerase
MTGGSAGVTGAAGTGSAVAGTTGGAGTTGSAGATGAAGTAGPAGTTGSAGTTAAAGRGGTTGAAGVTASAGRGGTTGAAGTAATAGRGGTTGAAAGTTGGGRGGSAGAAIPSTGCGAGGAGGAPASGRATIDVSGTAREYILKLPAGYDPRRPYPLIFAFHGARYDAESVASGGPPGSGPFYGIEAQASGAAIFVAPQATSSGWSPTSGNDIAYVNAMVARFQSQLCIDRSRIFATGFSAGGIMTIGIGCQEADVFRAIAPMSASLSGTCPNTPPIAYWSSHATNDPTINISQGEAARDAFRARNHCQAQTVAGDRAGCVNYQGCDPGYPVSWCTFTGVHEPAPFAGEAIWAFFAQF